MRWFFSVHLPPDTPDLPDKEDMVRVTVATALGTRLEPCCICDAASDSLTDWLLRAGVTIVRHETPFLSLLEKAHAPEAMATARGSFLRVEIPEVAASLSLRDAYALYTDYDVMFMRDPSAELAGRETKLFAAAHELRFDHQRELRHARQRIRRAKGRYSPSMNAGVMLLNLPAMAATYDDFSSFIRREYRGGWVYEQTAYQKFYGHPRMAGGAPWDELPLRFNWKPCWGLGGGDIDIVHFHGPKPFQTEFPTDPTLMRGDFPGAALAWRRIADAVRLNPTAQNL